MKKHILTAILIAIVASYSHAQLNLGRLIQGGTKAVQALTLSDEQILQYVGQYIEQSDRENKVCGPESPYTQRINKLTQNLKSADGVPLNFKVYENSEINAFACADGSVRIYTGLMDVMNDNELLGVIGHEIGHVAHHDTRKAFKQALLSDALKDGLAGSSSRVARLTDSQLGAIAQNLGSAKYSQKQENAADDFGYEFLKAAGLNPIAMRQAFVKMQQLENSTGRNINVINQLFSSHPQLEKRIKRMTERAYKDGFADKSGNPIEK